MTKTEKFVIEIESIKAQLNTLENEYAALYTDYEGNAFATQNKYAAEFENLTLLVTHELSSQISFGIASLQTLSNLITFRKKHKAFSNEELLHIIDKKPTRKDTLEILKEKNIKKCR